MSKAKTFNQDTVQIYNGTSPPEDFFREFGLQCLFNKWKTDGDKIDALQAFIAGKAKRAYDKATTDGKTSFKDYEAYIIQACDLSQEQKFNKFYDRKLEEHETVSGYKQSLLELLNRAAPKMDPAERASLLRAQLSNNVSPHLRQIIKLTAAMGEETYDKFLDSVGEDRLDLSTIKEEPFTASANSVEGRANNNYNAAGNNNRSYQNNFNNQNYGSNQRNTVDQRKFDGYCDYPSCNQYGHKMSFCPIRLENRRKQNQSQPQTIQNRNNSYQNRPSRSSESNSSNGGSSGYNSRQNSNSNYNYRAQNKPVYNNNNIHSAKNNAVVADDWFMNGGPEEDSYVDESNNYHCEAKPFEQHQQEINILHMNTEQKVKLLITTMNLIVFGKSLSLNVLLDPGSDTTFLSPRILDNDLIQENKDKVTWKNYLIKTVVAKRESKCMVIPAKMQIGSWLGNWKFVVSDHVTSFDAIIGLDFFKRHNTMIEMSELGDFMKIENKTIQINTTDTSTMSRRELEMEQRLAQAQEELAKLKMAQFESLNGLANQKNE